MKGSDIVELKDTVEMMCSDDYRERFKAEYYQTIIRYEKLIALLGKEDASTSEFDLTCPRSTYNIQLRAMEEYIAILEARAVMENIKLEEMGK